MNKETLIKMLEDAKKRFDEANQVIEQHTKLAADAKEAALIIKGEYGAIEKLITEFKEKNRASSK